MMKKNLKQEKGITMIALVVTVIILLILTNMLIYNAEDNVHIQELNNLYNDLQLLRDKVSTYYNQYGTIPAKIKYTNISRLQNANILSSNNDLTDEFYVIDLEAMQGITLSYGKDYENIKIDAENADIYTDVYIINANSHNIFYSQGVGIKQNEQTRVYYTDYTTPDNTTIDLRYIDEILIPDEYYYIGKYKDNGGNEYVVISKNKAETVDVSKNTQYIWQRELAVETSDLSNIELLNEKGQNRNDFIKSVNHYKGYFKNAVNNTVEYLEINENKWSEEYDENEKYIDKNGDIAYIPKGFRVSIAEGTNEIRSGLVITDDVDNNGNSIGNEFVWVPVNNFYEFIREDFGTNRITSNYFTTVGLTEGQFYEPEANGRTVDENANTSLKEIQNIYKSVKTYKGFYIGRYETGIEENESRTGEENTINTPTIKKNKYIYNYINWGNSILDESGGAVEIARGMYTNSTLCYGVQWDAIMRWINQDSSINGVIEDSSLKGNYDDQGRLIKTGNDEAYTIKNIYDLAGNVSEWTMENYSTTEKVLRGGEAGSENWITSRETNTVDYSAGTTGFRVALYIK